MSSLYPNKHPLSYSKEGQDYFALAVNHACKDGRFIEIGSNFATQDNNTYFLERVFDWRGLLVEYDSRFEETYKAYRTSPYLIADATTIDYRAYLDQHQFPKEIHYLQIDLEEYNRSTLTVLEQFEKTVFPAYRFRAVTFEHDIYQFNSYDTRLKSREIFARNGYVLVFPDVRHSGDQPFEDWYVHESVDPKWIAAMKTDQSMGWWDILKRIDAYRDSHAITACTPP